MRKYAIYALVGAFVAATVLLATPTRVLEYEAPEPTEIDPQKTPLIAPEQHIDPEPDPEPTIELLQPLVPICACESGQGKYGTPTHYEKDGVTVLRGKVNPRDIGICQINLDFHGARSEAMGLDVFVEADNIAYANWLYTQQGSTPWNWSKSCWQ